MRVLFDVAGFGAALPVLLGAWRLFGRPTIERVAWLWMACSLGANLWMLAALKHGLKNNFLSEFSAGLKALLVVYVLGELVRFERSRRWFYAGLAAFLCLWIWRGFEGDFLLNFSPYTLPAYNLLLAVAASVLILERMRSGIAAPFRDFGMLIGLATVITYAPSVGLTALSELFWQENEALVGSLWIPRQIAMIFGLVFYSLAFAWTIPSRSSSGSSSSAA